MSSTTELPERICAKCQASDTEPHHVVYVGDGTVSMHVQCCAENGCPICSADMQRAHQEGADLTQLREFLMNRPADHLQRLSELGVAIPQEESGGEHNDD